MKNKLLLGTRKGLLTFERNGTWNSKANHFLGNPVSFAWIDKRTNTWWAALDHGHWGSKLHRSMDEGKSWKEVEAPKYPEGTMINEKDEASLKYIWCMASGGNDMPERIYLGTEPGGLFVSDNNGDSFELVKGLWNHPSREKQWFGGGRDFAGIHSIIVDPDDSTRILVGISVAGVFETVDGGANWTPKNKGLKANFLPDPDSEIGQDPHLLITAPTDKHTMWQQNHCGIFVSRNGGEKWEDVSSTDGPANFGFAIAVDETDPECAWVVPGVSDEIRIAVDNSMCVCRTDDCGKTWTTLTNGLPQGNAFDITYRHALDITEDTLAFGTTTGNLYFSENRGDEWQIISNNLPMIHSLFFY